jgi:hypothetical protein
LLPMLRKKMRSRLGLLYQRLESQKKRCALKLVLNYILAREFLIS